MMSDRWTRHPLSPSDLADERARMVRIYAGEGIEISSFTCDECPARFSCVLAFDAYSTDGDCLAEK